MAAGQGPISLGGPAMKKAMWIRPETVSLWEDFVRQHPLGWVCHLPAWRTCLERSFPHIQGHFLAVFDEQTAAITAGLPVYAVKSPLTGRRLVSTPFSSLSDPLLSEPQDMDLLFPEITAYQQRLRASRTEIHAMASPIINRPAPDTTLPEPGRTFSETLC